MTGLIQITNPQELISRISRAVKGKQKSFLETVELSHNTISYEDLRKLYLDSTNDMVREIIGILFGQDFSELFLKKNGKI